jgi:glutamate/tyrosine decarboxylase-like PLP-dependent enzyme
MDALREAVGADRNAGKVPICVVGNAGTVNSGAIDDLDALADFCGSEDLWFHVDGAFGATAAISPALKPLLCGMERADSLAFDLHKWMYMPYDVGCVLVRSAESHRGTFAVQAAYLDDQGRGLASGPAWFKEYGLELSRSARALKVWFSLKEHGLRKFQALVEQNVAQARYLADMVEADQRLELIAPVSLNIVCFRFRGGIDDENVLTALNKEILLRLQESGAASPSSTILRGRFAIRVANVNHRSRREDFEFLINEVIRLGEKIEPEI